MDVPSVMFQNADMEAYRRTFTVSESKLGQRTSTVHVALRQGQSEAILVVGYFTQSNIEKESGLSISTGFVLSPPPVMLRAPAALLDGTDTNWALYENPFKSFRKAGQHVDMYLPTGMQPGRTALDIWLHLEGSQRFTQRSLGYVVDTFPQIVENEATAGELQQELQRLYPGRGNERLKAKRTPLPGQVSKATRTMQNAHFWYPTVLLNVEVKKLLPDEGVEWLFSRVRSRKRISKQLSLHLLETGLKRPVQGCPKSRADYICSSRTN